MEKVEGTKKMRCPECKKNIIEDVKWNDWLELMHFVMFLRMEESISEATYEEMTDKLMTFKMFASEGKE